MPSIRRITIFFSIFIVTAVSFSSCTISQRRYRSGFHLEWRHRLKGQESDAVGNEKRISSSVEASNTETIVTTDSLIRPTEGLAPIHQNSSNGTPIIDHPFPEKNESESQNLNRDEVNRTIKADLTEKSVRKTSSDKNGGIVLLGILFTLAVLIIPPILFSVAAYWIDLSGVGLAVVWIVWAAGIVAALLLFSGLWPIVLSCLIWNVVFTITTFLILLINS